MPIAILFRQWTEGSDPSLVLFVSSLGREGVVTNLVRRLKNDAPKKESLKCQYLFGWFPLQDISPTSRQ
jgi:hypothetical protein